MNDLRTIRDVLRKAGIPHEVRTMGKTRIMTIEHTEFYFRAHDHSLFAAVNLKAL